MPDTQQHITSLQARFTSGNEIQVEKAVVTAVEVAAILAYIEALEADAERYRLLRDKSCPPHNFYVSVPVEFAGVRYTSSEVDDYIDAARKGSA